MSTKRHLHHVQGRDICSCPKCPSVIERDKQIVCSHNGIRHHTEKERTYAVPNKKEFHKDNTECRGTGTKDVIMDDSINIQNIQNIQKSMTLRVKIVTTVRGQWIVTRKDHRTFSRRLVMFCFLI